MVNSQRKKHRCLLNMLRCLTPLVIKKFTSQQRQNFILASLLSMIMSTVSGNVEK